MQRPSRPNTPSQLITKLGVELDSELLVLALTHRSFAFEHGGLPTNERLEFLGDAVLGAIIAEQLFREYPERAEGELSAMRASIVSQRPLAAVAREIELNKFLLLGRGEQLTGGADKDSILSDALEALIGAVYLSHGSAVTQTLVLRLLANQIQAASASGAGADWKANLIEFAQSHELAAPEYEITWTGPDHARHFTAKVTVGDVVAVGEGSAKKHAEQAAAQAAYAALGD